MKSKRIVIITGGELRHDYFRISLSNIPGVETLRTYSEQTLGRLAEVVRKQTDQNELQLEHLRLRDETEKAFFSDYCSTTEDKSNVLRINKGDINLSKHVEEIVTLNPDLIITYGCSIIAPPLIQAFPKRIINIHLGLSPYYRGSGTNYFPFVNNEPQFCGVTFMWIDEGIDTGEIIHQMRAEIKLGDNVHTIGNRLISQIPSEVSLLIEMYPNLRAPEVSFADSPRRLYKNRDFTAESLGLLYGNFSGGMLERYLEQKEDLHNKFPILRLL